MAAAAASRPSGPVLSIPTHHSASPAHVKLAARPPGSKSVSVSSSPKAKASSSAAARSRRSCTCSPTNHPGSFRCSLHKKEATSVHGHGKPASRSHSPAASTCRLVGGATAKRTGSALAARLGGAVESRTWARRALLEPSPHRRRAAGGSFRRRPSRLSAVSIAGDRAGDNGQ